MRVEMVGGILDVALSGVLTREDLAQVGARVSVLDNPAEQMPSRLIDLSGISEVEFSYETVAQVIDQRRGVTLRNSIKSALVAPMPLHMGFARMFQTLNDHPQITVRIFSDREAALLWLASDG